MTEQQERYDRIAAGYGRWWAPVLAPTAVRVLDLIDGAVANGARRLLDLGTGTATLAVAAVRRWPSVEVTGIDASAGMLAAARATADTTLPAADRARFLTEAAFADRLPFDDASFDAAVCSFVLQLVPSRHAALREVHRVLRQGAPFAHVTWLTGGRAFAPDAALDAALELAGFDPREPDTRSGDYRSVDTAAAGLRRAGFRNVTAERSELVHRFDAASYQGFVEEFDEEDTFRSMDRPTRRRVQQDLRARLEALAPEAFELRLPVVFARGTRP
jgi:SAM-dependent methyltransferase